MDFCYLYVRVFSGAPEEEKGEILERLSEDILENFYEPTEEVLPILDYFRNWLRIRTLGGIQGKTIFLAFTNIIDTTNTPEVEEFTVSGLLEDLDSLKAVLSSKKAGRTTSSGLRTAQKPLESNLYPPVNPMNPISASSLPLPMHSMEDPLSFHTPFFDDMIPLSQGISTAF
jgi:hypothetical protein